VGLRAAATETAPIDTAVVAQVLEHPMGRELIALYVAEAEQMLGSWRRRWRRGMHRARSGSRTG